VAFLFEQNLYLSVKYTQSSFMPAYKYPRPVVAVDCVVFGWNENGLHVLLVKRAKDPFAGKWSLPGGFVLENEVTDETAKRVLQTKGGLKNVFFEQLYTFSNTDRDPRGWIISVAHYALVGLTAEMQENQKGTAGSGWVHVRALPRLAFDHREIIDMAVGRLKNKVRYAPIGFELLPDKFTMRQLQQLYEDILDTPIDKRNFQKKLAGMKLLRATGEKQQGVAHKPAQLFCFDDKKYKELGKKGFHFEL
jgi:8-oxo-dGTP diphosphatase